MKQSEEQPEHRSEEDSDNNSADEGLRALTAFFRREVREHRAAREEKWAAQTRFRTSDAGDTPRAEGSRSNLTPQSNRNESRIVSLIRRPDTISPEDDEDGRRVPIYKNDNLEEKIDFDNMLPGTEVSRYILRPDRPLRRWWDIFMLTLLFYVSTVSVFAFSFLGVLKPGNPLFVIERIIDVACFVDIALNFVTAFERLGVLIVDPKEIAYNYMVTWFFIDLLSTFPWDIVALMVKHNRSPIGPSYWQWPRYLRLLRVFKMGRIARVLRLKRIVTYFEIRFRLKYAYVRAISLLITVSLMSHWTACMFYYFGALSSKQANWYLEPGIPRDLYGRYIAALYFSVYTITTIGYGDVTPTNTMERTYVTVMMFAGAAIFAFIISQVSNLAEELSSSSVQHRQRMDTVMDLASYRNLNTELVFQIRRYFQRDFLRQRVANESLILEAMSPDLRMNVLKAIYSNKVDRSRLLSSIPKNDLDEVYGSMKGVFVRPGESVYSMHDKADCMYIILRGEVTVHDLRDGNAVKLAGDVFGESELLFNQRRRGRARCKKYTELVRVPRDAVIAVLERHRRILRELRRKEALQLWAEAIGTAEQQVRYWKMAGELRARALRRTINGGGEVELRRRLANLRDRSGWSFGDIFPSSEREGEKDLEDHEADASDGTDDKKGDSDDSGFGMDDASIVSLLKQVLLSNQALQNRMERMESKLEIMQRQALSSSLRRSVGSAEGDTSEIQPQREQQ